MKILIVLTSYDQLGDTGKKNRFLAGRVRCPMWDLADDAISIALIEAFVHAGKPVAAETASG